MIKCPHCGWQRIRESRQNYISQEPTGNNVFVHEILLAEMVDVYICGACGFSWRKDEGRK